MTPLAVGGMSEDAGGEFGHGTPSATPLQASPPGDRNATDGRGGYDADDHPFSYEDEREAQARRDTNHGAHHRTQTDQNTNDDPPRQEGSPQATNEPVRLQTGRPGRNEDSRKRRDQTRQKRAHVHIATLNMKGKNTTINGVNKSKWEDLENMIKTRRIGIMALQETHLDNEDMGSLARMHQRRLVIINSPDPERPTQSAGVAFALNKEVINTEDITVTEVIPGRAILLNIGWRDGQRLRVLNIYAPNVKAQQITFWDTLYDRWGGGRAETKPDLMVGDFNAVEDDIDRAPARRDDRKVVSSMRDARIAMGLTDAWRHAHASIRRFTYTSSRHSMSRLDRICAKEKHHPFLFGWETASPPISTDHRMVSVMFAPEDSPELGQGRWTWPRALLSHPILLREIEKLGKELGKDVERWKSQDVPNRERNPQIQWHEFKLAIASKARKLAKASLSRVQKRIETLQAAVSNKENDPRIDGEDTRARGEATVMRQEYEALINKTRTSRAAIEKTNWLAKGEVIGPYWMKVNAEKKPREVINRLRVPGQSEHNYEKTSSGMSKIMRDHYDAVQRPPEDDIWLDGVREERIEEALESIPDCQKLKTHQTAELDGLLSEEDVAEALKSMPGNKATGIDGIPYEIWRYFHSKWVKAQKTGNGRDALNVVFIMTAVYNDVQMNGVAKGTQFNKGWVCPLYKKKEKTDPANYRPITLLNSDYKIMTKALAMRLARVAGHMIHPDQAGFVPGRSIFDHVRLSKAMIDYAEAHEENGIIVALDQEKAYDRIRHDYLWRTLEAFKVPETMIKTIRLLYENAESVVTVNGVESTPFQVTRGVRQGDPLSCLLFDLAIEPMACMLRKSEALSGFRVDGSRRRILVNLFADDTLVYLSEGDNFTTSWRSFAAGAGHQELSSTKTKQRSYPSERKPTGTR
jgi:exonuclease III